jgi:DNA polymerase-1
MPLGPPIDGPRRKRLPLGERVGRPPDESDNSMREPSLFDVLGEEYTNPTRWIPKEPPCLDGIVDIQIDTETNGLRWWDGNRPIGISICLPEGSTQYLPWGHRGGNLDEETVKRWAQRELRGKRITNLNTRFDVHMLREWGVDLEAQGNEVSDVGHYAALLDDHRQKFSLDAIMKDYLGREKVGKELNAENMADYHAGDVAPRAEGDVRGVHDLIEVMWPKLTAEGLHRVRKLEDEIIYVVCEMEKNGSPIDLELLEKWIGESGRKLDGYLQKIYHAVGFHVNPDSPKDMDRVWEKLELPTTAWTKGGEDGSKKRPSYTDLVLKAVDNPIVQDIRMAGKLASLRSKYLCRDKVVISPNGIMRYALHQLRSEKEEGYPGAAGTVTGRFSSTAVISGKEGVNIQQRMKVAKQRVAWGFDENDDTHDDEIYPIRKLHIPKSGRWLSSDAMQIEYRIFANYANNPVVLEAYAKDPMTKFHNLVLEMLRPYKPDLTYRRCKDCNFAKVYGAGLKKLALMLEFITPDVYEDLKTSRAHDDHPKLAKAKEIDDLYNRLLPEVKPLLRRASNLAESRGYVQTVMGRRSRFPDKYRLHKAFNSVDQGSGADIMKQKLVELHRERKYTGLLLRFTVHDEVNGDAQETTTAARVAEILNSQSFPTLARVPILWDTETGANWAECKTWKEDNYNSVEETRGKQGITDLHFVGSGGVRGEAGSGERRMYDRRKKTTPDYPNDRRQKRRRR